MLLPSPSDELDNQSMEAPLQVYSAPQPASAHVHALPFVNYEADSYHGLPLMDSYKQSGGSGEYASLCPDYDQDRFQASANVSPPAQPTLTSFQAPISPSSSRSPARAHQIRPGTAGTEEKGISQSQSGTTDEKDESLRGIESFAHFETDIPNESPDDFEYDDDDSAPGSEVDENTLDVDDQKTATERQAEKKKAKRFRLTHTQTRFLQNEFNLQPHPDAAHRLRLSKMIPGLSPRQVQVWFQNRRAKLKRLPVDDRERISRSRALPRYFDYTSAPLVRPYGIAFAQQKRSHGSYPFGFGHGNEGSPSQRIEPALKGFELTPRSGLGLISPTSLYNSQSSVSELSKAQIIQSKPSIRFSRFQIAPNTYQTPPCSPIIQSDTRAKNHEEEVCPSLQLSATEEFLNQPLESDGVSMLQSHPPNRGSDYSQENFPLSVGKKTVEGTSRCYPSLTQQRKEEFDNFSVSQSYSALQAGFSDLDFPLEEQDQIRNASLLLSDGLVEPENPYLSPAFSSSSYIDYQSPQNSHSFSQVATQNDSLLYSAPRSLLGLQLQLSEDPRCIYSQQPGTGT